MSRHPDEDAIDRLPQAELERLGLADPDPGPVLDEGRQLPAEGRRAELLFEFGGEQERTEAFQVMRDLASRAATGGRPLEGDIVAAERAYRAAKGKAQKVRIAEAMEAGGYKSPSRIYELKKAHGWDD